MLQPLTLMAVHAHPDDEAISTGGILARYASEGVRTVLVTCTNGEMGDAPDGAKPGDPGHDEAAVVKLRAEELRRSCEALGVEHLEMLGFRDSGMMGWPSNDDPGSFWSTPLQTATMRLQELFEQHRPQVVVTYDDRGFYGHPDHIQAHRAAVTAFDTSEVPRKLYCPAIPQSRFAAFGQALQDAGLELPADPSSRGAVSGTEDDEVAATIDCSGVVERKRQALLAHESQAENVLFLRFPLKTFARLMAAESFVRWRDRTGHPIPEDDLFAGLR